MNDSQSENLVEPKPGSAENQRPSKGRVRVRAKNKSEQKPPKPHPDSSRGGEYDRKQHNESHCESTASTTKKPHHINNRNHNSMDRDNSERKSRQQNGDQNKRNQSNRKTNEKRSGNRKEALNLGSDKRNTRRNRRANENDNGENDQQPNTSDRNRSNVRQKDKAPFPPHSSHGDCLRRYASNDPTLIRGRLRALPKKDGMAFVTCDRGSQAKDTLIEISLHRNRALDGDLVFVELLAAEETNREPDKKSATVDKGVIEAMGGLGLTDEISREDTPVMWQDDREQMNLWNPLVRIRKVSNGKKNAASTDEADNEQRRGKVIFVVPLKVAGGPQASELNAGDESYLENAPMRVIVGILKQYGTGTNGGARYLLVPNNKSLPEFLCTGKIELKNDGDSVHVSEDNDSLFKAEYVYGSWGEKIRWPPCLNVKLLGMSCNAENETIALLAEHGCDYGEFSQPVLKDVETAVRSGVILPDQTGHDFGETMAAAHDLGWKPTPEMYEGRRDYRKQRIFTIDPTTAKDLDDALHVTKLSNGRVEIGVHIADVSHFVQHDTAVDEEAQRRATTVYLVDRTVPMLPRPLCEVACSLNENVERLAFSCVWQMNMDGTLDNPNGKAEDVWYGKTVIKSCSRLDYATAQNIIEGKICTGEKLEELDETFWPKSRRPTGGHTINEVAADVRLMHVVAQARRMLRFQTGALALNGIKLAFQLESDGETPRLCAPYPLRDSNRLVEEYMLLANYLVAQRLITNAGGLALLRHHPPPAEKGLNDVADVAKEGMGFDIDATSSKALQVSLNKLGRECDDELVLQCVTQMLMTPMQPAEYMAACEVDEECWRHFALNIPYYTHFTSPIRRYPDVLVHRLLQATIDGEEAVDSFPMTQMEIKSVSEHCNDKRMASKKAQERSDRVFLALYLRRNPLKSQLGVVLSVGQKTFTVFVPSLGLSSLVFLDEHKDQFKFKPYSIGDSSRILIEPKKAPGSSGGWSKLEVKIFTKVKVACICKDKPPIDVKIMVEGPWIGE